MTRLYMKTEKDKIMLKDILNINGGFAYAVSSTVTSLKSITIKQELSKNAFNNKCCDNVVNL